MTEKRTQDHVPAVFSSLEAAEAAVEELREIGIADEHLGVAMHEPGDIKFEEDEDHEVGKSVAEGATTGAVVGVLAGIAIMAAALPGIGTVGVGGLLAAGGAAGALGGVFGGGLGGVLAKVPLLEEEDRYAEVPLERNEILVVAKSHDQVERVREVMERHGGRCIPEPGS